MFTGAGLNTNGLPRRLVTLALGLISLALPLQLVRALDPTKDISQYVHTTWRIEDGLPQNGITKILETRDGYLWVGTQEGLARFDGVSFTSFDHTNTPPLDRDYISDLAEDSQGTLWIATTNGGVASFHNGLFTRLKSVQPRGGTVLAAAPDGTLWIGGYGGLRHFKNGVLMKSYTTSDGLSGDPIGSLVVDRDGALWIGSHGGLNRLVNGKISSYSTKDGLLDNDVKNIRLMADGSLFVRTRNSEFMRLVNGRFEPWHVTGVVGNNIDDLILDRDGSFWLASTSQGLLRVKGKQVSQFAAKDDLTKNAAAHLYEDRDGNLWVGTQSEGLERFRDGSFTTFAVKQGVSEAYSIIEDNMGTIWTTGAGGLYQVHGNEIKSYKTTEKMITPWSLWIDHASNLLVGTSRKLMEIHAPPGPSTAQCIGIPGYEISGIVEDSRRQLWMATRGGGLARCVDGKVTTIYSTSTGLPSNALYAIASGSDGTIWLGSDNGLNSIQNNQIKSYPTLDGLSNAWIISLYYDSRNILWIGTFGQGLLRLEAGHFTRYTTRQGLQNDAVYGIVEDNAGNLWIGSDNGISRITRDDLDAVATNLRATVTPMIFGKADGMESSDVSGASQPNVWRAHDGRLWFPTARGVVAVDPTRLNINDRAPLSHVEQLTADESLIDLTSPVRLQPGTRRLEIRYTAPNLSSPERTQFRYQLEGFDEQWIPSSHQRVAHYTNLPPGHYTFRVSARVGAGPWSRQEGLLAFELSPQFYQAVWFRLLCGLAVICLLWGIYRLRVSFLHAHAAVLEERQRIARDIHDSLAQSLSGILFQTEAALISMARAPLMTSTHITSARDLAKTSLDDARYSVWNLSPPVLDQKNLSESLSSMARQLTHGRVAELDIHSTGATWDMAPETKHHIVMIAQEAISNAIQHGEACSISVEMTFEADALSLVVTDDGAGFSQRDKESKDPARGYGLRNMRYRSKCIGAIFAMTSQLGSGTRVTLSVPRSGRVINLWHRLRNSSARGI